MATPPANFVDRLKDLFGWGPVPKFVDAERQQALANDPLNGNNPANMYHDMMEMANQNRLNRYDTYDAMDQMADVSSILDAYSEDCCQTDNRTEATVWVEGSDETVVNELNNMLRAIDAESFIEGLARDLGKYGDDFAKVNATAEEGVVSLEWHDPRDVERIENKEGILLGYEYTVNLGDLQSRISADQAALPTFKAWDFIHWRIYKQKRLPFEKHRNLYGTSLMRGSDRIAKQIKILDDLLMIIRLTRSLDRRIYYVDVGRAPVEEEVKILKRWRRALKRQSYMDPVSGRFDSRFDPHAWCFTGDTSISLLDGRERTMVELLEEYGTDKNFYVYSRNADGLIVPGKAKCVGKTRLNAELVRVTLDNGKSERCTPDHRWMMKDGSYKEAKDLKPGDSLSPLYRKVDNDGYESILQDRLGKWELTHRRVAQSLNYLPDGFNLDVHHDNRDKLNNDPDNLMVLTKEEHMRLHALDFGEDQKDNPKRLAALRASGYSEARGEAMVTRWRDTEFSEKLRDAVSRSWEDPENNKLRLSRLRERNSARYKDDPAHKQKMLDQLRSTYYKMVKDASDIMVANGFDPLSEWDNARSVLQAAYKLKSNLPKWDKAENYLYSEINHSVLSVEFLSEREDTYDITVDDHHNFALSSGVLVHNSEDEFWPTKENSQSKVENVPGMGNVADMVDINHFRDKFFGSFRAPKAYFGYEGDVNAKATLSTQSIRWARSVNSLQRSVKVGLTRLCQIHLAYKGMNTDAEQFKVLMVAPSAIELIDRLESWQTIIDVAERMSVIGQTLELDKLEWTKYILQDVLWLNDQDTEKFVNLLQAAADKAAADAAPKTDDKDDPDHGDEEGGLDQPDLGDGLNTFGNPETDPDAPVTLAPSITPSSIKPHVPERVTLTHAEIQEAISKIVTYGKPRNPRGVNKKELPIRAK